MVEPWACALWVYDLRTNARCYHAVMLSFHRTYLILFRSVSLQSTTGEVYHQAVTLALVSITVVLCHLVILLSSLSPTGVTCQFNIVLYLYSSADVPCQFDIVLSFYSSTGVLYLPWVTLFLHLLTAYRVSPKSVNPSISWWTYSDLGHAVSLHSPQA